MYPLIVSDFGFEVLGLWSLIAAVATVLRSADAGFSQLIQREGGSDRSPDELSIVKRELVSVRVAYIALFLVASSALAATAPLWSRLIDAPYPTARVAFALVVVVLAVGVQLIAQLEAAVLVARQDAAYVQVILAITPLVSLAGSLIGVAVGAPIEGLATGTLLASAALLVACSRRVRLHHLFWNQMAASVPLRARPRIALGFARRGLHFYTISIGTMIRLPFLRFLVAATLGLSAVATVEIALRITRLARGAITAGGPR